MERVSEERLRLFLHESHVRPECGPNDVRSMANELIAARARIAAMERVVEAASWVGCEFDDPHLRSTDPIQTTGVERLRALQAALASLEADRRPESGNE